MQHQVRRKCQSPADITQDAGSIPEALGPMPREALNAMVEYGLSDAEIGTYYNLPRNMIMALKERWGIANTP
jgi:hypothetical protein